MTIKGPLTGIRIADLTQAHAGSYGSQLMGDMGAEVIKIENPIMGDPIRPVAPKLEGESYYTLALNRNKRGITLDLYTESGKQAFYDLVKISDVVFDNSRVGVMDRIGADFESLKKVNPKIIACSITGFGSSGPYKDRNAMDIIALAMSGIVSVTGEQGRTPVRPGIALADLAGGMFGAMGILAAIRARDATGEAQKVEVNLLDACLSMESSLFSEYFITGKVPPPQGPRHLQMPLLGIYATKNSHIAIGPSWPRIARVVGEDWMIDDPKFNTTEGRFMNKKELEDVLEKAFQKADTEDWLELMKVEDVPAAPVLSLDKVVEDPQVIHNKAVINMNHPVCGPIKAIASPIKMPTIEGEHVPPPTLGQHTDEVLREVLGYGEDKIKQIKEDAENHAEELKEHVRKKI